MRLVEEISKTRGAKYCSVDSAEEFRTIMNQVAADPTIDNLIPRPHDVLLLLEQLLPHTADCRYVHIIMCVVFSSSPRSSTMM